MARNSIANFDKLVPCPSCRLDAERTLSVPDSLLQTGVIHKEGGPSLASGQGQYKRLHGYGKCRCC